MFEFLGKVIIGAFLSGITLLVIESFGGGGISIKGTKKYNKQNEDADKKVKEILKNGTGSSRKELQEWWDKYHPPK